MTIGLQSLIPLVCLQAREYSELWSGKGLGYWIHEGFSAVSIFTINMLWNLIYCFYFNLRYRINGHKLRQ